MENFKLLASMKRAAFFIPQRHISLVMVG